MQISVSQGSFGLTHMQGSVTEPWKKMDSLIFSHNGSGRLLSVLNAACLYDNSLSGWCMKRFLPFKMCSFCFSSRNHGPMLLTH